MSQKPALLRIRDWPRWTIIPIGLCLTALIIVIGLLVEPVAASLNPVQEEPVPTVPAVAYSQGPSESCHNCHFSLADLEASSSTSGTAGAYLIAAESVATPHGKLGCQTCHGGDGEAADKETAHQGLVADMSADDPKRCIICHEELPDEIPHDRLRVPHGQILAKIEEEGGCEVPCSDCHGGVGHGFDPLSGETFCSMTVCLDCHQERNLEVQMADCDACHLKSHEVPAELTCSNCHTSAEEWEEVDASTHPIKLEGKHAETDCFQCHQYPIFAGLSSACADCHTASHDSYGDGNCATCHDAGGSWAMESDTWEGHAEHWDQYKGQHTKVTCAGCHFEGYSGVDPNCSTCHKTPEDHSEGRADMECTNCHQADEPWTK